MALPYSLATLWFDRQRYIPGVLAVGFSALLISLQCGLLLGLFSITSMPIDRNTADLWMGAPGVQSVDLGRPIREGCIARVAAQPEIERCEPFLQGFAYWARKEDGATELCMVVGARLAEDSLGAVEPLRLDSKKMAMLTEPRNMARYLTGIGELAEVPARAPSRGPPYWKSVVLRRKALGDAGAVSGSRRARRVRCEL